jgi:ABC-type polysaccharide/polyol phosphate export permease
MNNYIELLKEFIRTDFKLRYKNSYLGIIWIVLKPLAMFSIIYLIWSNIMVMNADYKMGLLLGIMIMSFFSEAIMMGMDSLLTKSGIILKIKFPREITIYSAVTIALMDFAFNMIVFVIFSFFTPIHPTGIGLLLFLAAIVCIFVLTMGVSLFLSILYIRLRDIHNLIEVGVQLIFWATPIYYTLAMMPEKLQKIIILNPLTLIVTYARKGLITGDQVRLEDFLQMGIVFLVCCAILLLGTIFFKKKVSKIAEYF